MKKLILKKSAVKSIKKSLEEYASGLYKKLSYKKFIKKARVGKI